MTGGSAGKNTGLLSRRGEIRALQEQAAACRERSNAFNGELGTLRREIAALQAQSAGIEAERKTALEDQMRYQMEEKRLGAMLEELQADHNRSEDQQSSLVRQIELLEEQCRQEERKLDEAQSALSSFREELAAFLCVNRSALSHELSRMEAEGLIRFRKNEFTLLEAGRGRSAWSGTE